MDLEYALYEKADDSRIVTITVNRPDKMNALNIGVLNDIEAAFVRAKADPECGVVPLRACEQSRPRVVLSNSFGFGGNNSVLCFSAPS